MGVRVHILKLNKTSTEYFSMSTYIVCSVIIPGFFVVVVVVVGVVVVVFFF